MPIYEYPCDQGHTFEVMHRMTDEPLTSCSTCEAPVQRVFHPVAVHFKGSGFYSTDYGKKKSGATTSSTSEGGSSSKESSEGFSSTSERSKKDSGSGSSGSSSSSD
jgi:putative FmdB family regulatory protein